MGVAKHDRKWDRLSSPCLKRLRRPTAKVLALIFIKWVLVEGGGAACTVVACSLSQVYAQLNMNQW